MRLKGVGPLLLDGATGMAAVCVALVAGLWVRDEFFPRPRPGQPPPTFVAGWRRYATGGNRMGPATAAVTIVEFADFQCSICKRAAAGLAGLRKRYAKDVAVVYRNYPGHTFAFAGAVAAQCAAQQGSFEAFHDLLYQQADSIGSKPWVRFAEQAGVEDTSRFTRCLAEPSVAQAVARDTAAAHELRIRGTPTFLINDLEIEGYRDDGKMEEYVAAALKRAGKK